ncbi:MAG: hypothetical protein LC790_14635 [Actinobacteria bacterium]|nr:hypothetical protein [Actinomycetota bacterium]
MARWSASWGSQSAARGGARAVSGDRRLSSGLKLLTSQEVGTTPAEHLESIPETTAAERAVADLLPIDASREEARAALERVPLWFHTFALNGTGVYTPGIARDHRYRLRATPGFAGGSDSSSNRASGSGRSRGSWAPGLTTGDWTRSTSIVLARRSTSSSVSAFCTASKRPSR